jgi:hypothetical protein
MMVLRFGLSPVSLLGIAGAGALAFFWFSPKTKAWFGLD